MLIRERVRPIRRSEGRGPTTAPRADQRNGSASAREHGVNTPLALANQITLPLSLLVPMVQDTASCSARVTSPSLNFGRSVLLLLACSCLAAGLLGADTTPATVSSTPNPSAAESLNKGIESISPWDISSEVRASFGWRENVTVSTVHSINRAFWRAEADSFIIRPIDRTWQFISFVNGDVLRYINPPGSVSGEQQWAAELQARWQPIANLRATLKGVGFLEDTFIDPSQSEGEQLPATSVRFSGGYVSLAPQLKLPGGFALEPSFQVKRVDFKRGYNGDYNETRPGLSLEWTRSDRLTLTATWYDHERHYSHLNPASLGRPIHDRLLALHQREGELKATTTFSHGGKWTVSVTGGMLQNRDRTNGVLDYNQKRAQLDAGWERGKWHVTLSGEAKRLDYLTQKVGFGIVETPRIADVFDVNGRIERDLVGKWTVFAENRWERNRSNINDDPLFRFSYRTNTSLVGVQRSF